MSYEQMRQQQLQREAKQIVPYDSPEAAWPVEVKDSRTGIIETWWRSRSGHILPDEHQARYNGCTHCLCDWAGHVTRQKIVLAPGQAGECRELDCPGVRVLARW